MFVSTLLQAPTMAEAARKRGRQGGAGANVSGGFKRPKQGSSISLSCLILVFVSYSIVFEFSFLFIW